MLVLKCSYAHLNLVAVVCVQGVYQEAWNREVVNEAGHVADRGYCARVSWKLKDLGSVFGVGAVGCCESEQGDADCCCSIFHTV